MSKQNLKAKLDAAKAIKLENRGGALVPMGKMIGLWTVSHYTNRAEASERELRTRRYLYGSPVKQHTFWDLEAWYNPRKIQSSNRKMFDDWRNSGIYKLRKEFEPKIEWLAERTGLNKNVLTLLFLMTGTKMFLSYQEHPLRFVENFKDLSLGNFLNILSKPFWIRWDLIMACFKMPWKQAMKRVWPSASRQMLKEITWSHLARRGAGITRMIRWGQEEGSLKAHYEWKSIKHIGEKPQITKIEWMKYCRNYGDRGSSILENYFRELVRAKLDMIELPVWEAGIPNPDEAHRRHEEISRLYAIRAKLASRSSEDKHRDNWGKFELPVGWTPLFSLEDFTREGDKMHHCVGGYFRTTECLFAHLEHEGEEATIQWRLEQAYFGGVWSWHIDQLYGVLNKKMPQPFYEWAIASLERMVRGWKQKQEDAMKK